MKIITRSTDTGHLNILKALLEDNGIPAFLSGENTARILTPYLMTEPGLWVYFDDQLNEAIKLVNNPDYQVINKLDVRKFYLDSKNLTDKPSAMNDTLIRLGLYLVTIMMGMYALVFVLQWLASS